MKMTRFFSFGPATALAVCAAGIFLFSATGAFAQGPADKPTTANAIPIFAGGAHTLDAAKAKDRQVLVAAEVWRLADDYDLDIGTQIRYTGQDGSVDFISSIFPAADVSNGLRIVTDLISTSYGFLKAQINLAERDGNAELLTSPQITVIDGQPADISAADKVPYKVVDTSIGNVSTQYFRFGVTMNVTPTIIDCATVTDKFVNLAIKVEVSEIMAFRQENEVNIPIASISQANTNVVVKSGTAFLMGGLYRERESTKKEGIPFLSAIPGIGKVFGNERTRTERSQVIFSVRPVVITSDETSGITSKVIDLTQGNQ